MFKDQIGRNMEVYVDDMLVKSKKETEHVLDLEEAFLASRKYIMRLNPTTYVFGVKAGKFLGGMITSRRIKANSKKIWAILDMKPPKCLKDVQ